MSNENKAKPVNQSDDIKTDVITSRDVAKAKANGKYYQCPFSLPVEIEELDGFFKSQDGKHDIYKHKSFISDPSKHYPTSYTLFMVDQPREIGFYLADLSMSEFQGKMQASLHYRKVTKEEFKKTEKELNASGITQWDTDFGIEIYDSEPAGSGYSHETYFIAEGKRPETIDNWQREVLKAGKYGLSVDMVRIKGQIKTRNLFKLQEAFKESAS